MRFCFDYDHFPFRKGARYHFRNAVTPLSLKLDIFTPVCLTRSSKRGCLLFLWVFCSIRAFHPAGQKAHPSVPRWWQPPPPPPAPTPLLSLSNPAKASDALLQNPIAVPEGSHGRPRRRPHGNSVDKRNIVTNLSILVDSLGFFILCVCEVFIVRELAPLQRS